MACERASRNTGHAGERAQDQAGTDMCGVVFKEGLVGTQGGSGMLHGSVISVVLCNTTLLSTTGHSLQILSTQSLICDCYNYPQYSQHPHVPTVTNINVSVIVTRPGLCLCHNYISKKSLISETRNIDIMLY